jgi:hypothetical protein
MKALTTNLCRTVADPRSNDLLKQVEEADHMRLLGSCVSHISSDFECHIRVLKLVDRQAVLLQE